jgi:cytochrome c-type biogenesis protein CcmF
VLPWRKASGELLAQRLFWPAVCGVVALGAAVAVGASGWAPLVAFALGGWAAGSALRQIVLATRRQGLRGFLGRANGGMIVHLGVIIIAVALAASNSYTRSATLTLEQGVPARWGGRTFELAGVREETDDRTRALVADVLVDGGAVLTPAITRYLQIGTDVPTPSVDTGFVNDLYITLEPGAAAGDADATIRAFVKPLILWMWLGGAIMAVGTLLAAFPGSRQRRPTDPVSGAVPRSGEESSQALVRINPRSSSVHIEETADV